MIFFLPELVENSRGEKQNRRMEVTHLTEDEMADIKKEVSVMCMKVCKTLCVNMSVSLADYDSIKWK